MSDSGRPYKDRQELLRDISNLKAELTQLHDWTFCQVCSTAHLNKDDGECVFCKMKAERDKEEYTVRRAVERAEKAEKQTSFLKRQADSMERSRPLCPDHRDKQRGKECLACQVEKAQAERDAALDACREALSALGSNVGTMAGIERLRKVRDKLRVVTGAD